MEMELPMDMIELHLHLGGSWPHSFLCTIADSETMVELNSFLDKIENCIDYVSGFQAFEIINKIVDSESKVEAGVVALCESLIGEGVQYVEIRTGLKKLGEDGSFEGYLNAVLRGIAKGCVSGKLTATVILSLRRSSSYSDARATIDFIKAYRGRGVVGLDISGNSVFGDGSDFLHLMEEIREENIPVTLHIGESTLESPTQQMLELTTIIPRRIGHGVLLCDEAVNWILSHRVPVEMCLTSAARVGMVSAENEHPAIAWWHMGHPVAVCTDDPLVFRTTLANEYAKAAMHLGISLEQLRDAQKKMLDFKF